MSAEWAPEGPRAPASPGALHAYFLRLGAIGFGGPIALVGYMQRDLVEERGWVSEAEYKEGIGFAQLAPGPLAAQLAMYIGWLRGGATGATLAGLAFVLPSFVMVLALSALYVRYGGLPWMRDAFYGIGAAVIAIIARSSWRLVRMTLRRDALLWSVFVVNAIVTAWTESEVVSVILASGVVVMGWRAAPRLGAAAPALAPLLLPFAMQQLTSSGAARLGELFWFFFKAGALVFGSGLAIVPFLYGGAVVEFGWLTDRQFLDAVAVSMITPGPVVITVAFMGFLAAGTAGASVAALGVFLPVHLSVVLRRRSFGGTRTERRFAASSMA